ncbi:hypothetical protein SAMN04515674_101456 [Pseudarcicella hirudinis]|uniref:Uncharacterized protein n=1 Tax=Pseudarcicella hirudinis TaxID=1079859 RepID=A0A1I5MUQ0_9BACT|nr:hypothetical protein [Pseudarcicella hirudinis]SFP13258.1 hypothetical protein SAMN04515674_101456 [Pseudarcicella hirudinis]
MGNIDFLSDFENAGNDDSYGLFSTEVSQPAEELLPHRGTPYLEKSGDFLGGLFKTVNKPESEYEPKYSSEDLEIRAELMVDLLMTKFNLFIGLAKGGVSELVVSDQDLEILRNHQLNGFPESAETAEIRERIAVKEKLEQTPPSDMKLKREILKKAVKLDLERKMKAGKLEELSIEKMILMMVSSEFSVLVGKNYGVFSSIGKNLIKKAKGFL